MRYLAGKNLVDLRLKTEIFDNEFHTNVFAVGPEFKYIHALEPELHLISGGRAGQTFIQPDQRL